MNSGEDLGFEFDLFFGLLLTGGEMLIDADLSGEPLDDDEEDVESSECAFLPAPPLSLMRFSA